MSTPTTTAASSRYSTPSGRTRKPIDTTAPLTNAGGHHRVSMARTAPNRLPTNASWESTSADGLFACHTCNMHVLRSAAASAAGSVPATRRAARSSRRTAPTASSGVAWKTPSLPPRS